MTKERLRLDQALVERGFFPSRARAQGAIEAGLVKIDGRVVAKSAAPVDEGVALDVAGDVHDYVSRGGIKLAAALDAFAVDPAGKNCLDLGASTGGFSEALLRRGATRIYAVDVGRGQLHPRIAADPRVSSIEATHARDLTPALIPTAVELLVADVSFISLKKALPSALALMAPLSALVALVKPQFEVGPAGVGKGGIVKNPKVGVQIARELALWLHDDYGFKPLGVIDSPIEGGDGNREFLIGAVRQA